MLSGSLFVCVVWYLQDATQTLATKYEFVHTRDGRTEVYVNGVKQRSTVVKILHNDSQRCAQVCKQLYHNFQNSNPSGGPGVEVVLVVLRTQKPVEVIEIFLSPGLQNCKPVQEVLKALSKVCSTEIVRNSANAKADRQQQAAVRDAFAAADAVEGSSVPLSGEADVCAHNTDDITDEDVILVGSRTNGVESGGPGHHTNASGGAEGREGDDSGQQSHQTILPDLNNFTFNGRRAAVTRLFNHFCTLGKSISNAAPCDKVCFCICAMVPGDVDTFGYDGCFLNSWLWSSISVGKILMQVIDDCNCSFAS